MSLAPQLPAPFLIGNVVRGFTVNHTLTDNKRMKIFSKNLELKQEFYRIQYFFFFIFFFIGLSLFIRLFSGHLEIIEFFVKLSIIFILCKLAYKSLRNLYYSFWSFVFLLAIYILLDLYQSIFVKESLQLFILDILILTSLAIQCYFISSPIYFPRVRWWVYDIRFMGDLKIMVEINNDNNLIPGRLTDLRRNAGCVLMFKKHMVGDNISIYEKSEYSDVKLKAEIISEREYMFGRGHVYGIKFILNDNNEKKIYNNFVQYWKERTRRITKIQFKDT